MTLGQLPDTPEELLKLDQVFIKSELKVGVIYVQEEQYTEEEILDNNDGSALFEEFLQILGDKVRLKGFDKYKGGLDTVHDLTGLYSVYTNWRGIQIMFHVSTLLPYEKHDPQKVGDTVTTTFVHSVTGAKSYNEGVFVFVASKKETHRQRYCMRCFSRGRQHELQSGLHKITLSTHIYSRKSKFANKKKDDEI